MAIIIKNATRLDVEFTLQEREDMIEANMPAQAVMGCVMTAQRRPHVVLGLEKCKLMMPILWKCVSSRTSFEGRYDLRPCCNLAVKKFLNIKDCFSVSRAPKCNWSIFCKGMEYKEKTTSGSTFNPREAHAVVAQSSCRPSTNLIRSFTNPRFMNIETDGIWDLIVDELVIYNNRHAVLKFHDPETKEESPPYLIAIDKNHGYIVFHRPLEARDGSDNFEDLLDSEDTDWTL